MTVLQFPLVARPRPAAEDPIQMAIVKEAFDVADAAIDAVAEKYNVQRSDLRMWMAGEMSFGFSPGTDHDDQGPVA